MTKKKVLWDTCGKPPLFEKFVQGSYTLEHYVNEWSKNIDESKAIISKLYNSILKLYDLDILKDECFNPMYISEKLRDIMKKNQTHTIKQGRDEISDFKKSFSAPTLENSNNIKNLNCRREGPPLNLIEFERSLSQQTNIYCRKTSRDRDNMSFKFVNREFGKMVINEKVEFDRMKTNVKKLDISNLLS